MWIVFLVWYLISSLTRLLPKNSYILLIILVVQNSYFTENYFFPTNDCFWNSFSFSKLIFFAKIYIEIYVWLGHRWQCNRFCVVNLLFRFRCSLKLLWEAISNQKWFEISAFDCSQGMTTGETRLQRTSSSLISR